MNQLGVVHPGLLASLTTYHYPDTVTIQRNQPINDSAGQPIAAWGDYAGHTDLPCRIAPEQAFSREARSDSQIYGVHAWDLSIAAYYATINETMRAVVGGVAYDIELVQPDGNSKTTHLRVRRVD